MKQLINSISETIDHIPSSTQLYVIQQLANELMDDECAPFKVFYNFDDRIMQIVIGDYNQSMITKFVTGKHRFIIDISQTSVSVTSISNTNVKAYVEEVDRITVKRHIHAGTIPCLFTDVLLNRELSDRVIVQLDAVKRARTIRTLCNLTDYAFGCGRHITTCVDKYTTRIGVSDRMKKVNYFFSEVYGFPLYTKENMDLINQNLVKNITFTCD